MRLGGFQVDFGSVLAWLGLIRARCAAGLAVAFGLLQGRGSASFGLDLVVWGNAHLPRAQKQSQLKLGPAVLPVRLMVFWGMLGKSVQSLEKGRRSNIAADIAADLLAI